MSLNQDCTVLALDKTPDYVYHQIMKEDGKEDGKLKEKDGKLKENETEDNYLISLPGRQMSQGISSQITSNITHIK